MALLTLAIVSVIFLAAFIRLWKNPPTIKFDVSVNAPINIPSSLFVKLQREATELETKPLQDEPIPEEILDYIDKESEEHARVARRKRVRMLKVELGSWDIAFRMLQREDSIDAEG